MMTVRVSLADGLTAIVRPAARWLEGATVVEREPRPTMRSQPLAATAVLSNIFSNVPR